MGMTEEIRAGINARLKQKDMTRADLARAIQRHPNSITRALNAYEDSGRVPPVWAAMLEALGLRLTVEPIPSGEAKNTLKPKTPKKSQI